MGQNPAPSLSRHAEGADNFTGIDTSYTT